MKAAVVQGDGQPLKIEEEGYEALDFANEDLVKATVTSAKLEDINDVFDKMKKGQIDGRIVLDIAGSN